MLAQTSSIHICIPGESDIYGIETTQTLVVPAKLVVFGNICQQCGER